MTSVSIIVALLAILSVFLPVTLFFVLSIALTDFKGFKRAEIKKRGWDALREGKYWMALAVTAVFTFVGGSSSGFSSNVKINVNSEDTAEIFPDMEQYVGVFALILLLAFIISIFVGIFVTNILNVGLNKFFILNLNEKPEFKVLLSGFTNGNYTKLLKIMFKRSLYVFLWSLLFVIPGIVKSFEYFMVPYILAENPDVDEKTAFRLSKEMMQGNKWRTFVLGISFIGWEILCIFTFGLGYFFLLPYIYSTHAALYEKLRMNISEDDRKSFLKDEMFGIIEPELIEDANDIPAESVNDIPTEAAGDYENE